MSDERLVIPLGRATMRALEREADHQGITVAELAREAIEAYIDVVDVDEEELADEPSEDDEEDDDDMWVGVQIEEPEDRDEF
jgi:predicted DNA-binding protein